MRLRRGVKPSVTQRVRPGTRMRPITVAWLTITSILSAAAITAAAIWDRDARAQPRRSQYHYRRDLCRGQKAQMPADERDRARCRRPREGVSEARRRIDAAL